MRSTRFVVSYHERYVHAVLICVGLVTEIEAASVAGLSSREPPPLLRVDGTDRVLRVSVDAVASHAPDRVNYPAIGPGAPVELVVRGVNASIPVID